LKFLIRLPKIKKSYFFYKSRINGQNVSIFKSFPDTRFEFPATQFLFFLQIKSIFLLCFLVKVASETLMKGSEENLSSKELFEQKIQKLEEQNKTLENDKLNLQKGCFYIISEHY